MKDLFLKEIRDGDYIHKKEEVAAQSKRTVVGGESKRRW